MRNKEIRQFKFKAWDGKRMHKAFDLTSNPKYWWEENKDYQLFQYTGAKDAEGQDIYEGDVVHAKGHYVGEGWYDTGEHSYDFIDVVKWNKQDLTYTCGLYHLSELDYITITKIEDEK